LLILTVLLTVGLSAGIAGAVSCGSAGCQQDPARSGLAGFALGQATIAIFAVLMVGGEYGSGMIRSTLTATTGRTTVLAAKAALLTAVVLAAGIPAALGSWLTGRLLLPGNGFTAEHGTQLLGLGDGPTLRAVLGSVLYLALVALLSLGVATAVRDAATAIGIVLGLLYLFPIMVGLVTNPDWHRHLQQIAPMNAGLAIQDTVGLDQMPIGPWSGLGVLAAWAAAALLIGWSVFTVRDA
jgi:ABC-2 type transport system permease protein